MDHRIRGLKDACIGFPKWQSWDRQRPEEAISILRKGIEDKFPWYKKDFNRKTTTAPRDQVSNLLMSHTRKYFPFLVSLIGNYDYTQTKLKHFLSPGGALWEGQAALCPLHLRLVQVRDGVHGAEGGQQPRRNQGGRLILSGTIDGMT